MISYHLLVLRGLIPKAQILSLTERGTHCRKERLFYLIEDLMVTYHGSQSFTVLVIPVS